MWKLLLSTCSLSLPSLLVLLLLFHRQICFMELSHTETQKPALWWQPPCSIFSAGQQEQSLAPFLQKDVVPYSVPTITTFCCLQDTFKARWLASCLETRYNRMLLQFLSNSSSLRYVIKSQIAASAHLVVPTEEALQVWDVIKRHPEAPTHADYSEDGK